MPVDSDTEMSGAVGEQMIADRKKPTYAYTKEVLLVLRESTFARTRPDYLSTNFDGDDNKFSPWKWLQHKWEEEGVKDRPLTRKNEVMKEECESTLLSPQRRAFSSGCRAPEDKNMDAEESKERARNWRQGVAGGNSKGDLKYHKNDRVDKRSGQNGTGVWREKERWSESRNDKERINGKGDGRGGRRREDERQERLPEWAEGPTSANDLIELKGFDEPKRKKDKAKDEKKSADSKKPGSRPTSNPSANAIPSSLAIPDNQNLLNSDEEFAKFLGIIDNGEMTGQSTNLLHDITSVPTKDEGEVSTGSRLSRFFKPREHPMDGRNAVTSENVAVNDGQSLLSRIFSDSPQHANVDKKVQTSEANVVREPLTLEDIERGLRTNNDIRIGDEIGARSDTNQSKKKGNPLDDPNGQASLMYKLSRMAHEQEGTRWHEGPMGSGSAGGVAPNGGVPANGGVPPSGGLPPNTTHPHPPVIPPVHPMLMRDPAHMAQVWAQTQYNAAMMQAAQALKGPVPPHIQDKIRQAAIDNLRQAQSAIANMARMGGTPNGIMMPVLARPTVAEQQSRRPPQATSLIPASVQKKGAVNGDEKKERSVLEVEAMKAEAAKKVMMQHQYAAMLNAMQGGLSMGAWRTPSANNDALADATRPRPAPLAPNENHVAAMTLAAQQQQEMLLRKMMMTHPNPPTLPPPQVENHPMGHREEMKEANYGYGKKKESMHNPLEKLLASVGAEFRENRGADVRPAAAAPISLEELERSLTHSK